MSAAVAMSAAAMASGLLPGGDHTPGGDNGSAEQVRANGPSGLGLQTQGSTPGSPAEQGGVSASQGDDVSSPLSTTPATPSRTLSATPSEHPGSSDGSDSGNRGSDPLHTSPAKKTRGLGSAHSETAAEEKVLALVNQERAKVGCAPVTRDRKLAQLADDFSDDMALRGFFDHINPDGENPWDRAQRAGVMNLSAENIARGQTDAKAVMDSWMASSGHRANILDCDYKTLGVGAHFGTGGPWWTQEFGF